MFFVNVIKILTNNSKFHLDTYKNAFHLWCCHSNGQANEQTRACEHVTGGWEWWGKLPFPTARGIIIAPILRKTWVTFVPLGDPSLSSLIETRF